MSGPSAFPETARELKRLWRNIMAQPEILVFGMAWAMALYGTVVGYADKAGGAHCMAAACFLWLVARGRR